MKSLPLNNPKTQTGLSLVELMVALLISTILLLGVLELFGSSSQTQRSANAVARLQENGRLVMDLIAREARRDAFNGCDGVVTASENISFGESGENFFPAESLEPFSGNPPFSGSLGKRVTFRHLTPKNNGEITKYNCKRDDLLVHEEQYFISFFNCTSPKNPKSKSLCVWTNTTGKTSQELLQHAEIKEVAYIQPCNPASAEQHTCVYDEGALPNGSFSNVKKLKIVLELCADTLSENNADYCNGSKTEIRRTFSSIIELRNRL